MCLLRPCRSKIFFHLLVCSWRFLWTEFSQKLSRWSILLLTVKIKVLIYTGRDMLLPSLPRLHWLVRRFIVYVYSRQPSPIQILIHQKQPENVEYFNYLGSMITNYARCTREIKSRIAMANIAFNKKMNLFTSKMDLNDRKKPVKCYTWIIALYDAKTRTFRKVD
jgi:hypothetical protein